MAGAGSPVGSLAVRAPVTGTVVAMAGVDDPVFAAGLVGPGLAIEPDAEAGRDVVAPIAGTVVKLHPHAVLIRAADGRAVLVHLGINTVQLGGRGFTLHIAEQDVVDVGQVLFTWDPAAIRAGGRSAVCPVIALEADPGVLAHPASDGDHITAGAALFTWT